MKSASDAFLVSTTKSTSVTPEADGLTVLETFKGGGTLLDLARQLHLDDLRREIIQHNFDDAALGEDLIPGTEQKRASLALAADAANIIDLFPVPDRRFEEKRPPSPWGSKPMWRFLGDLSRNEMTGTNLPLTWVPRLNASVALGGTLSTSKVSRSCAGCFGLTMRSVRKWTRAGDCSSCAL